MARLSISKLRMKVLNCTLEVQLRRHHTREFSQHLIIGAAAKEILRCLLEASGYTVNPEYET